MKRIDPLPPQESRPAAPPQNVRRQSFHLPVDYPVIFEEDCLRPESDALRWAITRTAPHERHVVAVFCDSGFLEKNPDFRSRLEQYFLHHGKSLELRLSCVEIPGGEAAKNDPSLVDRLHKLLDEAHFDRHCVALTFGGGSVIDAVGYAAATFHRGMRLVRVPTTVLAQNDAGVGVKNGINALGKKNLLGTFAAPFAVLNDVTFLDSLEQRDRRAGLAEAVKVALIRDGEFFRWLEENSAQLSSFSRPEVAYMVRRTAELHLDHIAQSGDPFETGSSRPLDFGHWSAHKLEALSKYELRHGEAVAIGIAIDCLYAVHKAYLSPADAERVLSVLEAVGFELYVSLLEQTRELRLEVLWGLEEFREHLGGRLALTLLRGVGRPMEVGEIDETAIPPVIEELKRRHTASSP